MEISQENTEKDIPQIGEFVMDSSLDLSIVYFEEKRLKAFLNSLLVKYGTGYREYHREYGKTKKIVYFACAGISEDWIEKRIARLAEFPTQGI